MVPVLLGTLTVALILVLFERTRRRGKRAAARWALSARIGTLLAEGLEEADTVGEAIRFLVPECADWALLHVVEDQQVRRAAIAHVDPAIEQRMRDVFA